ncbi:polysaccharide deacetylase family protein [Thauera sp.]|uniref:polysaccharide deacetylase family protein n=1 Tax=Thauera sp. TaxID=1905334 RepID=UPI0039E3BDF0
MKLEKLFAGLLSGSGQRARLSTLIFHRVRPAMDPYAPRALHARRFDDMLGWLGDVFNVLPPDEAIVLLARGALPPRALTITFDDGYADNAEVAMPILQRHGMRAAFFIATDFLDGGVMWNDKITLALRGAPSGTLELARIGLEDVQLGDVASRRNAIEKVIGTLKYLPPAQRVEKVDRLVELAGVSLPRDLMMSTAQVRALRAGGMVIGGHTCAHPILASLPPDEAEREIRDNKARLEAILGEAITLFAYPNGGPGKDYRAEHARMAERAGYAAAFTTGWGVSRRGEDPYQLARFTPWDESRGAFVRRLILNMRQAATQV